MPGRCQQFEVRGEPQPAHAQGQQRQRIALLLDVVRADQQLIINGFGFEFLDGFGVRSVPTLISTSSTFAPMVPVPLPTSSPIPIPGVSSSFNGLIMSGGSSRSLPMLLQFGCGVSAPGTLVVGVITAVDGRADVKHVNVRIAR